MAADGPVLVARAASTGHGPAERAVGVARRVRSARARRRRALTYATSPHRKRFVFCVIESRR